MLAKHKDLKRFFEKVIRAQPQLKRAIFRLFKPRINCGCSIVTSWVFVCEPSFFVICCIDLWRAFVQIVAVRQSRNISSWHSQTQFSPYCSSNRNCGCSKFWPWWHEAFELVVSPFDAQFYVEHLCKSWIITKMFHKRYLWSNVFWQKTEAQRCTSFVFRLQNVQSCFFWVETCTIDLMVRIWGWHQVLRVCKCDLAESLKNAAELRLIRFFW